MFSSIFFTVLKSVAIPIVAFLFLRSSFLGEQGAFLAVTIALSIVTIVSILVQVIKIVGNTVTLRAKRVFTLVLTIAIEVISVLGFWLYYGATYA